MHSRSKLERLCVLRNNGKLAELVKVIFENLLLVSLWSANLNLNNSLSDDDDRFHGLTSDTS